MQQTPSRSIVSGAIATCLLLAATTDPLAAQTSRYDFDHLMGSDSAPYTSLDGQDNWTSVGTNQPVPCGVSQTLSFDGSPGLRFEQSGPGFGCDASRINDASFSFPAYLGSERSAYFQVDVRVGFWGSEFALGHDVSGDGVLRRSQPDEIGPRVFIARNPDRQLQLRTDGSMTMVSLLDAGLEGATWARLRVVMDLAANGGAGSASVLAANLTAGTALMPVPGLQDIPLGLDGAATTARNPTLWDAMFVHFLGAGYGLDNFLIGGAAQGMRPSASPGRRLQFEAPVPLLAGVPSVDLLNLFAVSGAGDVNGDGFADIIVGSPEDNAGVAGFAGSARVYSGADGSILWTFAGDSSNDLFGQSVSGAGDVNGDGFSDVIVGAFGDDPGGASLAGSATVYSGADGSVLWSFGGDSSGDRLGESVSEAGDVNRDGFADVIVGAPSDDPGGVFDAGSAFVYSGADGSILWTFAGSGVADRFGTSVSGAGDVNRDGFADLVVGSPNDDPGGLNFAGSVFVFSGADGSLLWTFEGSGINGRFGSSVGDAGDVDGDGFADVIVGAPQAEVDGVLSAGAAFVYSGADGSTLWSFAGGAFQNPFGQGEGFGSSVGGAGDVNGDGFADVAVGSVGQAGPEAGVLPFTGSVRVYSGRDGSLLSKFIGPDPQRGLGVAAGVGDVDGNGLDDLAFVVIEVADQFGTTVLASAAVETWTFGRFEFRSPTMVTHSVSPSAGSTTSFTGQRIRVLDDLNGDGFADYAIGSESWDISGTATNEGILEIFSGVDDALLSSIVFAGGAQTGSSVVSLGDGTDTVLVGASGAAQSGGIVVAMPAGAVRHAGLAGDQVGTGMARVGDLDGDGDEDLVVLAGAGGATGDGYLLISDLATGAVLAMVDLPVDANGGRSIDRVGDVDGDGVVDVLVGCPFAETANGPDQGRLMVYSGQWLRETIAGVAPTVNQMVWNLALLAGSSSPRFGLQVAGMGDVDRDGFADFAVSAPFADNGGLVDSGSAFVVSGADASTLLSVVGSSANNVCGRGVDAADFDGDGCSELVLSCPTFAAEIWSVGRRERILAGTASAAGFGSRVAAGDINGDGMPDLIVSASGDGSAPFGEVSVFRSAGIFNGTADRIGTSCQIANGNLPHAEARGGFYVGSNGFDIDLRAAGPSQATTLLIGTPSPSLPLDLLGLVGCSLHVSQPFLDVPNLTDSVGRASQAFQAPVDLGFVGNALDFQWVVVDVGLPTSLPLALTDGVRVTFGR